MPWVASATGAFSDSCSLGSPNLRRMVRARVAGVVAALACALTLAACSGTRTSTANAPAATPAAAAAAAATTTTTPPRPYEVATREVTYVDRSRPTPKNNDYPGAPTRTIPVTIAFPARGGEPATDGAPFATILFSHGHGGLPEHSAKLFADLVRAGYVVVAPVFPLSHAGAPGGPTVADIGNQPLDDTFVLDQVLAARHAPWLQDLIDPERIGTMGHSLGGLTTYGLVYNTCCVDRRIKAAVVMSGVVGRVLRRLLQRHHNTAARDPRRRRPQRPVSAGRAAYAKANPPKYFLTIIGGAHSTEEQGGTTAGQQAVARSIIAFFDRYVRGDERSAGAMRKVATKPGLTKFEAQP